MSSHAPFSSFPLPNVFGVPLYRSIQGIHNIFIVIPQFLVTGISSIIFAIFDPDNSALHSHHLGNTLPSDGTTTPPSQDAARQLFTRSDDTRSNSMAIIFRYVSFFSSFPSCALYRRPNHRVIHSPVSFRLGGIAAAIAFILSYRLAKELKRH